MSSVHRHDNGSLVRNVHHKETQAKHSNFLSESLGKYLRSKRFESKMKHKMCWFDAQVHTCKTQVNKLPFNCFG